MTSTNVWNCDPGFDSDNGFIIGIDFGTSNSCASIWHPTLNRVKIIKDISKNCRKLIPSNVYFDNDDFHPQVGFEFNQFLNINSDVMPPLHVEEKLLLGTNQDHNDINVRCTSTSGKIKSISAVDLCSYIIQYVYKYAISYIDKNSSKLQTPGSVGSTPKKKISGIVIGIPVSFSTTQVAALEEAVHKAGITNISFLSESTAAALSYGLLVVGSKTVAVFDVGGGTTDVTVLRISEGGYSEVIAREGDKSCGGRDYDRIMLNIVLQKFISFYTDQKVTMQSVVLIATALKNDQPAVYSHLVYLCGKAKEELTESTVAAIQIKGSMHQSLLDQIQQHQPDFIVKKSTYSISNDIIVTRTEFEIVCADLTRRAGEVLRRAIRSFRATAVSSSTTTPTSSNSNKEVIDELVMVGGSSLMPCIQAEAMSVLQSEKMKPFLLLTQGGEDRTLCTAVDPHFAVVEGLAIRAAILMGYDIGTLQDVLMMDILPHSIGVLSWKKKVNSHEKRQENYKSKSKSQSDYIRVFDPIIRRGERIPATCCLRFPIETNSKFVSLDIYEDRGFVSEVSRSPSLSPVSPLKQSDIKEVDMDEVRNEEVGTRYKLMGTYDVPIESNSTQTTYSVEAVREVEVEFTLNIHGGLTFKVRTINTRDNLASLQESELTDDYDDESTNDITTSANNITTTVIKTLLSSARNNNELIEKEDPLQMMLLAVCAAVLLILYGFAKAYLIN